jgi:hypothetical protein
MTGLQPCTCSSACQADHTCRRLPRFQAHLDAAQDAQRLPIHRRIEACANHLGTMVVTMTTWAREHNLTNAHLTILAIEPPLRESYPRQPDHRDCAQTSGLVFSIIYLDESGSVPVDVHHASDIVAQSSSVRPARMCSDQLSLFEWLPVSGNRVRALIPLGIPAQIM